MFSEPRSLVAGWRDRIVGDRRALAWVVAAVVAVLVAIWLLRPPAPAAEESVPRADPATAADPAGGSAGATLPPSLAGATSTSVPTEVVAHAAGAVVRPGLYRLDPRARVDDLVRAAGGLSPDADAGRVNLAAPIVDGSRVYVPRVGEADPPATVGPDAPAGSSGAASGGDGSATTAPAAPVNLNTADQAALESLPGVGPATATAIIDHRTQVGGFRSVDELLDVRGIGEAKLDQLRDLVIV